MKKTHVWLVFVDLLLPFISFKQLKHDLFVFPYFEQLPFDISHKSHKDVVMRQNNCGHRNVFMASVFGIFATWCLPNLIATNSIWGKIQYAFLTVYGWLYIPRAPMTFIFEGQPLQNKVQTPIKTRGPIWVLGIWIAYI